MEDNNQPNIPTNNNQVTSQNNFNANKQVVNNNINPAQVNTDQVQTTQTIDNNYQNNIVSSGKLNPKKSHKSLIVLLIILVVLLIAGVIGFLFVYHKKASSNKTVSTNISSGDYTFYNQAKPLKNLNFFKTSGSADYIINTNLNYENGTSVLVTKQQCESLDSICIPKINYYQMGLSPNNQPIIGISLSPDNYNIVLIAIENSTNKYQIAWNLVNNEGTSLSQSLYSNSSLIGSVLNNNVVISKSLNIKPLDFPKTLTFENTNFISSSNEAAPIYSINMNKYYSFNNITNQNLKLLTQSGPLSYYSLGVPFNNSSSINQSNLVVAVGGVAVKDYTLANSLNYNSNNPNSNPVALNITWNNSQTNNSIYMSAESFCNVSSKYLTVNNNNFNSSSLTQTGSTPQGLAVYQLPINNPILNSFYQYYKANNQGMVPIAKNLSNMTIQQYQNNHGLIVTKNGLEQYVLYTRSDLVSDGGC